jgi:hypothetical protein
VPTLNPPDPERRRLALEAHDRLTRAAGFGRMTPGQMGRAAGVTWRELHAMQDAGLVRFEDARSVPNRDEAHVTYLVLMG